MANTRKVALSANPAKERPESESLEPRVVRPRRDSLDGFRSKLAVRGKDPAYAYRFVLDTDCIEEKDGTVMLRPGQNILMRQADGWELVDGKSVSVGSTNVYSTDNTGSVIRIPSGSDGQFLYLMRIRKEWFEDDKAAKAKRVLDTESLIQDTPSEEGMYGSISIKEK
jgi:hypothetical protein